MPAGKPDHHAVLGLASDASDDAIRAAYKKLALQWHPDRHLVGKERAAQVFIEVNQAYHALMDGKESTHSSSADTSSSSAPSASADPTHSDTHSKSTQASSRPPSATSTSSRRSGPHSSKSSSAPCKGRSTNTSKSSTKSRAPPSKSSSSHASSDDLKSSSHPRSAKPSSDRNKHSSDRMKNGRKFSKSHDQQRDPPRSAASKTTTPAPTCSHSSGGVSDSARSESHGKKTEPGVKHGPRSEKSLRNDSGRSHTSSPVIPPPSGRLHKSSKLGFADDLIHKLSKETSSDKKDHPNTSFHVQDATPYGSPLRAINTPRGASKEWIFPLPLTLDEMYHGTSYRFLVTRELLSHQTEQVEISIDIPPGMRSGTRIVCPNTGHQRKDGTLQDVVFLVEEVPEERFSRVKDDLFLDVCIPWADPLADQGGEICIQGIDGKDITFTLPYPIYDKATEGQVLIKDAGMPVREGCKMIGRGDMIIRWRVVFATNQSKWQTLKKALHLDV